MTNHTSWKAGIATSQPIVAVEIEAELWAIFGGTYRLKQNMKTEEFEKKFPAPFSIKYGAHMFKGTELPETLMQYIDFVKPLKAIQEEQGGNEEVKETIRYWKTKSLESKFFHTMYYEEPSEVKDFVPPSYWDELVYYMRYPEVFPAIAIIGPTGNGKTTAAVKVNESLGVPYLVIDMNEFVVPEELVGFFTFDPEKGNVWHDGTITHAFREGMNVIINEFDAANPRAVMCLQSVFQDPGHNNTGRYVTIPGSDEDRVYPQGACSIILTMNTYGTGATRQYVGRNAADAATMDRMAFISSSYENEDKILMSRGYSQKTANQLLKWAQDKRKVIDENALKLNVSPRTLLRMAHLMENRKMTLAEASNAQFLQRVGAEDRELLV